MKILKFFKLRVDYCYILFQITTIKWSLQVISFLQDNSERKGTDTVRVYGSKQFLRVHYHAPSGKIYCNICIKAFQESGSFISCIMNNIMVCIIHINIYGVLYSKTLIHTRFPTHQDRAAIGACLHSDGFHKLVGCHLPVSQSHANWRPQRGEKSTRTDWCTHTETWVDAMLSKTTNAWESHHMYTIPGHIENTIARIYNCAGLPKNLPVEMPVRMLSEPSPSSCLVQS